MAMLFAQLRVQESMMWSSSSLQAQLLAGSLRLKWRTSPQVLLMHPDDTDPSFAPLSHAKPALHVGQYS